MATLTSSYQFLGRSSVMTSTSGSFSYYILLYGKTSANATTGIHTVTIKEVLASTTSNATYYYYTQAHNGKINGTTAFSGTNKPSTDWNKTSFTENGVTYYTGITLGEGSVNVDATDGNAKNITLSCYYAFNDTAASYTPAKGTSRTVSVTATLAAIPRGTTPTLSATSVTMGNALTITLKPSNSTFKHKVTYDFGSLKGQTSGVSTGASFTSQGNTTVTFTPPTSLGSQIPSANSGKCTINCYTYNSSGSHIGTKTIDITLNVPTYNPEIKDVTLTGNNLLSGVYVQGKSTVTVDFQFRTLYGAGIKEIVVEIDGKQYKNAPYTSSVLTEGSKSAKITVTDTRNKSFTYTSSAITVYPYSPPIITGFTVERQADGTTVIATVKGNVAALNNKNAKTITVALNGVTNTITSSAYEINGSTTFTNVSTDDTFTATAIIKDSYTSAKKEAVLPTVAVTMDFHHSGTGVAFGKVAEHGGYLDVNFQTICRKSVNIYSPDTGPLTINRENSVQGATIKFANSNGVLGFIGMSENADTGLRRWKSDLTGAYFILDTGNTKDYVVEQGTSGVWSYRKWNNGRMEVYGTASQSPTALNNGTNSITVTMPVSFVDTTFTVIITPAKCGLMVSAFGDCNSSNEITHTKNTFVLSYKYNHSVAYTTNFNVMAVGKWK